MPPPPPPPPSPPVPPPSPPLPLYAQPTNPGCSLVLSNGTLYSRVQHRVPVWNNTGLGGCLACSLPWVTNYTSWPPPNPPPPTPPWPPPAKPPPPSPSPPSPPPPVEFPEQGVFSLLLAGTPTAVASLQAGPGLQALQAALVALAQGAAAGVDARGAGVSVLLNATATWFSLLLPVALTTTGGSAWSPAAQSIALGALAAQVGIPPSAAGLLPVVAIPPPPQPPPPTPPPPPNASASVSAAPAGRRRSALSLPSATGCATAAGGGVTFTALLGPVGQGLAAANASALRMANLPAGALQVLLQGAGLAVSCAVASPQVVANVTFLLALPAVLGPNPAAPLSRLTAVTSTLQLLAVNGSDLGAAAGGQLGLSPLGMALTSVTVFAPPPLLSPPPSPPGPPVPPSPPMAPSPPTGPPGPPPTPAASFPAQLKVGQDGALTQVILGVVIGSAVVFVLVITACALACKRVNRVLKANAEARDKEEARLAAIAAAEEARELAMAAYGAKSAAKQGRIPEMELTSARPSRKASQRSSQYESETEEEAAERRRRRRERRRAREGSEASYV